MIYGENFTPGEKQFTFIQHAILSRILIQIGIESKTVMTNQGFTLFSLLGEQQNKALAAEIMIEELNNAISKLKANKALGAEDYTPE